MAPLRFSCVAINCMWRHCVEIHRERERAVHDWLLWNSTLFCLTCDSLLMLVISVKWCGGEIVLLFFAAYLSHTFGISMR